MLAQTQSPGAQATKLPARSPALTSGTDEAKRGPKPKTEENEMSEPKTSSEMWLKELPTDNGWITSQIRSYNARLGDFIVGGNRSPKWQAMIDWRKDILNTREEYSATHATHAASNSDFGCRQCHIAGWEVDTSLPQGERDAILALA